jgi:hypothetical protein
VAEGIRVWIGEERRLGVQFSPADGPGNAIEGYELIKQEGKDVENVRRWGFPIATQDPDVG